MKNLKAGRELDMLIATKIMGAKGMTRDYVKWEYSRHILLCPYYSTNIRAANEILKKFAKDGFTVELGYDYNNDYWFCDFSGGKDPTYKNILEEAICVAAVKAINKEISMKNLKAGRKLDKPRKLVYNLLKILRLNY